MLGIHGHVQAAEASAVLAELSSVLSQVGHGIKKLILSNITQLEPFSCPFPVSATCERDYVFRLKKISPRNSAEIVQTVCRAAEEEHCQSLVFKVGQEIHNMQQAHKNLQWLKELRIGFSILHTNHCSGYYHGKFKFIKSQRYFHVPFFTELHKMPKIWNQYIWKFQF